MVSWVLLGCSANCLIFSAYLHDSGDEDGISISGCQEIHQFPSRLSGFRPEEENISTYLERAKLYFDANAVGDAKKVSVLLTVIEPKNYSLLQSLTAPALPREKSFADLKDALIAHFQPAPLVIAKRFRFYQCSQAAGESVLDYAAELRRLAITCDFGAFLKEALRDRFVCGLKAESIQKKLLAEADLSMDRAVELARGMEIAAADTKGLKQSGATGATSLGGSKILHTALSSSNPPGRPNCQRCGKSDHDGRSCRFKQAKCHAYGKIGHIAPACRSVARNNKPRYQNRRMHKVDSSPASVSTATIEVAESELGIHTSSAERSPVKPITVDVQVAGKSLSMELDTGAAVSLISETLFRKTLSWSPLHWCSRLTPRSL